MPEGECGPTRAGSKFGSSGTVLAARCGSPAFGGSVDVVAGGAGLKQPFLPTAPLDECRAQSATKADGGLSVWEKEAPAVSVPTVSAPHHVAGCFATASKKNETRGVCAALAAWLDNYFQISQSESSVKTEIRAGLILFASMCYIVAVNPEVLATAHLDRASTATATTICGAACTLLLSLYANLPLGAAPGMGLNTLFAFELVLQQHLTPAQALACCLVSGVILLALALAGLCDALARGIPLPLKKAVVVGLGLFQTFVGMVALRLVEPVPPSQAVGAVPVQLAPINSASQLLGLATLAFVALLLLMDVPGAILLAVTSSVGASLALGASDRPTHVFEIPEVKFASLDFSAVLTQRGAWLSLLMVLVLFIDTGGVLIGLAAQSEVLADANAGGTLRGSRRCYIALALGVIMSSLLGTSPIVIFLESAAAVSQGGRTGLTALVAALLLGGGAFVVPLIRYVPPSATAPIMILIGCFMAGASLAIPWDKLNQALPAYATITFTAFSCSITNGLLSGLAFYATLNFPFMLAKVTKWQWLRRRLVVNEAVTTTSVEKRITLERSVERKREQLFSLAPSPYDGTCATALESQDTFVEHTRRATIVSSPDFTAGPVWV